MSIRKTRNIDSVLAATVTVPTINSIFAELGVHLLSEKYNFFTREMYFKLSEYWNKQGVFVEVATFLDPRIKLSNHQERDVRENILQMIKAYLSARYPESSSSSAQETEEAIFFRGSDPRSREFTQMIFKHI